MCSSDLTAAEYTQGSGRLLPLITRIGEIVCVYCENDTAYYFACRTSEYILEVSKLSGKLKWIKSKIDADEPFYYDIAHGVLYEKEGYLELMLKEIL